MPKDDRAMPVMRSEAAMMELVLAFARHDERVRLVGMEGSRLDPEARRDRFQDYDITYVVTEMGSFTADDGWLEYFGDRIMMQKPEAMSLFPPELGGWFSYLMLFEDGNRIDLKLVPLADLESYLSSESRLAILLDKDQRVASPVVPSDRDYLVHKPTHAFYDDCCNEFWWVSTYVAKGLCRGEFLYAADHLNRFARPSLLRMQTWEALVKGKQEAVKPGKSYKYLPRLISPDAMESLKRTFRNGSPADIWDSLFLCFAMFRRSSRAVGDAIGHPYPDYDSKVSVYIRGLKQTASDVIP